MSQPPNEPSQPGRSSDRGDQSQPPTPPPAPPPVANPYPHPPPDAQPGNPYPPQPGTQPSNPYQPHPGMANPYQAPVQTGVPHVQAGDATGGIIPYKNAPALIGYYLGIFSLIPCIGFFLAIPAFILGVIGLNKNRNNPAVKGTAHAWVGIVLGTLCALVWGAIGLLILFELFVNRP